MNAIYNIITQHQPHRPAYAAMSYFRARKRIGWLVLFGVLVSAAMLTQAAEPADATGNKPCLQCHAKNMPAQLVDITRGIHGPQQIGCVHCHTPDADNNAQIIQDHDGGMLLFKGNDPRNADKESAICLGCHDDNPRLHWQSSMHAGNDLTCSDCHTIHGSDPIMDTQTEAQVCYSCHAAVRGRMLMPYSHPLRDGHMACSDCHQAHGSAGPTRLADTEACTECHAEKRGPFLWEHSPVSEDCTLCHDPHGAIHPGMLTRRQPQLCQSCHMPSAEFAARHARRVQEFWPANQPDNVNRLMLGESCMNCHTQVHGSNHPSGAGLLR